MKQCAYGLHFIEVEDILNIRPLLTEKIKVVAEISSISQ